MSLRLYPRSLQSLRPIDLVFASQSSFIRRAKDVNRCIMLVKDKGTEMIRGLLSSDFNAIVRVINDAAQAYKGVIPDDRWEEPYMSAEELQKEIEAGIRFFGWVEDGHLLGVVGIQPIKDTTLIRHAYVLTKCQRGGIGSGLLEYLMSLAETPEVLVGTWADAIWAIRFYEKHGFKLVSPGEKDRLLRTYWNIPERQVETSVVLRFTK